MSTVWYDAEFIGQKVEVAGTNRFWFKLKSDPPVAYKSGQFFVFDLPSGEKRADRWRSYSIANIYDGSNILELCITYEKGGVASQYLFNDINKGDVVKCKGPEGNFILPEDTSKSLVFIATGAGLVPFRAMIQQIEQEKLKYKSVHLIFGARKEKTILFYEELEDWSHFIDHFTTSICLSKETKLPKPKNNMDFFEGHVHQVYLNKKYPDKKNVVFMICGWSGMIDEAVAHLVNTLKIDRTQIKYELFG